MNVIDEEKVAGVIVKPALDRLQNEIVPALEAAIKRRVDDALSQASSLAMATLAGVQGVESSAMSDVRALLASLDGWTATISIPAITIQLKGPGASAKAIAGGEVKR